MCTGINILSLWAPASVQGFAAPIWMTYRQAVELRAHVRKAKASVTVATTPGTIGRTSTHVGGFVILSYDTRSAGGLSRISGESALFVFMVECYDGTSFRGHALRQPK